MVNGHLLYLKCSNTIILMYTTNKFSIQLIVFPIFQEIVHINFLRQLA